MKQLCQVGREIAPSSIGTLTNTLLSRAGHPRRALEHLRAAVALDPELAAARRVLARVLLRRGRRAEAEEQLKVLLELIPDDEEAARLLGG